jgi:hypothetical protein
LIPHPFQMRSMAGAIRSMAGEGDHRATRENRAEIDLYLVDDLLIQCLSKNVTAALDQQAGHVPSAEIAQNGTHRFAPVDHGSSGKAIGKEAGAAW